MIQRIQTIYLLLTILLAVLFLSGDIIHFQNGNAISLAGISTLQTENLSAPQLSTWPLTVFSVLVPLIALITIFLFRNRPLQMKFTLFLILMIIFLIGAVIYFTLAVNKTFRTDLQPGIKLVIPVAMLILSALAYRSIKKDQELVKSYDRLR
jgi:glucan phosphoethanolaminetransferase (alkaline phosphatase superfamily)